MVRQINPGLARLWIKDARQFGYASPVSHTPKSAAVAKALEYLEIGVANNQLDNLPKLVGTTDVAVRELLERHSPVISSTGSFLPELDNEAVERHFTEIMRLFLLGIKDPASAMRTRTKARVFLSKLDRTGVVLLRGLAASGIGIVFTQDQGRVLATDTLELGHPRASLGLTRIISAKNLVSGNTKTQLHSRVSGVFEDTEVAILISTDVVVPTDYQLWLSRDVPHISITFTESGVEISHLVFPGITPCLSCIEQQRLRQVPNWNLIAPQLSQIDRDLSESSMLLFASGLVLNQVLNVIDLGIQDPVSTDIISLDRKTGLITTHTLPARSCGCINPLADEETPNAPFVGSS